MIPGGAVSLTMYVCIACLVFLCCIEVAAERCDDPGVTNNVGLHCKPSSFLNFIEVVAERCDDPGVRNNLGLHCKPFSLLHLTEAVDERCDDPCSGQDALVCTANLILFCSGGVVIPATVWPEG